MKHRSPSHVSECLVSAGPARNSHPKNHDDQRQHDGIFNRRRAVFRLQKFDHSFDEARTHDLFLSSKNLRTEQP